MENIITHPTIEEKKNKAIEIMKALDIYKPYIQGFKQKDKVCFFENFGGFWLYQEPEIEAKMREIERSITRLTRSNSPSSGNCGIFLSLQTIPKNGTI